MFPQAISVDNVEEEILKCHFIKLIFLPKLSIQSNYSYFFGLKIHIIIYLFTFTVFILKLSLELEKLTFYYVEEYISIVILI